jgi:hypothetical protein
VINKIMKRGSSVSVLVRYLFGPGEANEHRDQRIIAADDALELPDGTPLDHSRDRGRLLRLSTDMDAPRYLMALAPEGGWMWHCAISLPPGEHLSDAQWAQAARIVVEQLKFTGDEAQGRAACRWIAVHHGPSAGGNDHIHLAVNLVREDGTVASTDWERKTMARTSTYLEKHFGLSVVEGRADRGMPSYSRAELDRVASGQRTEPDRLTLARHVRAAEMLADDETAFVNELRAAGLWVQPRQGPGKTTVTGYSVALPPPEGGKPIWFGGGKLAPDLTLPQLRNRWPANDPARAISTWAQAASRTHPTPRKEKSTDPAAWQIAVDQVDAVAEQLRSIPVADTQTWRRAARESAAVYAVLWQRLEHPEPGPLAAAVDGLARAGQTRTRPRPRAHSWSMRHAAHIAHTAPLSRRNPRWLRLIRALIRLMRLVFDALRARAETQRATALAEASQALLARIRQHTPAPAVDPEVAELRSIVALSMSSFSPQQLRQGGHKAPLTSAPPHGQAAPERGFGR